MKTKLAALLTLLAASTVAVEAHAATPPHPSAAVQRVATPASAPVPADTTAHTKALRLKRAGAGLLGAGVPAFVLGAAMQGGWAITECYDSGVPGVAVYEYCETSSRGRALATAGIVMMTLGTASTIAGAIMITRGKRRLRALQRARITPHLSAGRRHALAGVTLRF